ncbi:MAG: hypothetical protein JWM41_368 [Gemmatimonadetes bacterium]|nr:hypothetical protein [Gemmatimonadota bacterium]
MRTRIASASALLVCAAVHAPLGAQKAPRVRLLNLPSAASKTVFGSVTTVRQLLNGGVLVNDVGKRQLVLLDSSLATASVVLDSSTAGNSYGPRGGALIPYGDSTLFVDGASLSMLVLSPSGAIARVMSVPRSQDAPSLVNPAFGSPGFDGKGRLVYRTPVRSALPPITMGASNAQTFSMPEQPDSAAVVAIDLVTRKSDTLGYFKIARTKMNITRTDAGATLMPEINPLQAVDEWAVLPNGSIVIVRGRDYHVDRLAADGKITSNPKIPYEWQRLTDEDKVAVIDSAKTAYDRLRAAGPAAAARAAEMGFATGTRIAVGGGGADGMRSALEGARAGAANATAVLPPATFVTASELPDYRPVFVGPMAVRGDADGNLWVRTTATRQGAIAGPIYDVINPKGELIDRVQVPAGRTIAGFGTGGAVYLTSRDDGGVKVERAAIR